MALPLMAQQTAEPASPQSQSAPMTKGEMKAQHKQQKLQQKSEKENAKAAKEQSKADKHQDKSTDAAEKAGTPKPAPTSAPE
jgi:hypothetical protein